MMMTRPEARVIWGNSLSIGQATIRRGIFTTAREAKDYIIAQLAFEILRGLLLLR
jgi:hypothetical protein